jgi:tRNA-dihydrouridine synthase B
MKKTKIGNVNIGNGVFLAPMEDVCDVPFRIICKKLGADIVYSEFIASEGIIRNASKAKQKMTIADEERPTAIQIFGGDENAMIQSAKIVEEAGANILDINFGCWVKKVVVREAGAAFLKKPKEMADLTKKLVDAVKIPVTVKTRLGWDKNSIVITDVVQMIEQAGAAAIAIHCRTRDMGMTGKADWSYISKIKELIDIPVILNGDIMTPQDAKRAFDETNCDAIMIGRGCIGYPFIFKRTQEYFNTGIVPNEPGLKERIEVCIEHVKMAEKYKGSHGVVEFRKHYSGYLKGFFEATNVRQKLMKAIEFSEIEGLLWDYYSYLESIDRLETVQKSNIIPELNCNNEKYVKKQLIEM